MPNAVAFGLLGPLSVVIDGAVVAIPKGKQRVLLAALLLRSGHTVSSGELTELLWRSEVPASAAITLQNYVKRLRRALMAGRSRLETQPGGYLIRIDRDELDTVAMEDAVTLAHRAARAQTWLEVASHANAALARWRGAPLADIDSDVLVTQAVPRLSELHFQA